MNARVLVIDDLFGRDTGPQRNRERDNLCSQLLLKDVTGDRASAAQEAPVIKHPLAEAVFCRGQRPSHAVVGDVVENDIPGTLATIRAGWIGPRQPWSLVLLDLCFYTGTVTLDSSSRSHGMPQGLPGENEPSGYFGLRLLDAIHAEFPDLPVIVLSSMPRDEVALEFTTRGAVGFVPRSDDDSADLLREYLWRHGLIPDETNTFVGLSKPVLFALRAARRVARERRHVLIRGERGTGKELLARYIRVHAHAGQKSPRPWEVVDAGALSPELYGSELFGHVRGAFTGADRDRVGRVKLADGGDLFLDEIGNMPPVVQQGLLRVIEQRVVTPLGENRPESVDIRLICATNEDLEGRAATGGFREDLLDRLREGGTVVLRPLREHLEDLDALVERLVREAEQTSPGVRPKVVTPEVIEVLRTYSWPGNVRELRTVVFRAVNDFPDVEYLVPGHVEVKGSARGSSLAHNSERDSLPSVTAGQVDDMVQALAAIRPSDWSAAQLAGALATVQGAIGEVMAGLVRGALLQTRKFSADAPDGVILIHPAMKLLTGDRGLTASRAADLVKKLLHQVSALDAMLKRDPILREAYANAARLRPSRPAKKADNTV